MEASAKTIIYKIFPPLRDVSYSRLAEKDLQFVYWKPTLRQYIPPGKNSKYFAYWLFHYFRIFKNRDCSALIVYLDNKPVSSLLIVPAHFKWPFMGKKDLQFTYVMTHPDYRGKGMAKKAIRHAIDNYKQDDRCFWYVTDIGNKASIRLCTKLGFEFHSYGKRRGALRILKETGSNA